MTELLRRAGRALDRLIFPRAATCMGCGDKSGCEHDWLCDKCEEALAALWCGDAPLPCAAPLVRLAAAYVYRDPAAALVRSLKYGSVGLLAELMAQDMARACTVLPLPSQTLVVPAPMHPRRERKRGYNQAELLARAVARILDRPHAQALSKLRNTRQQARLDHAERARNLQGSIGVREDVRGRAVLLVDDVYTTGATMRICAQALLDAGATAVYGLTYAVAGAPQASRRKGGDP